MKAHLKSIEPTFGPQMIVEVGMGPFTQAQTKNETNQTNKKSRLVKDLRAITKVCFTSKSVNFEVVCYAVLDN